ncbi:MAG: hypothetical protein MZV65_53340 [Chromatiales bacterium]|nr:hypothetical protein [Chromatiales bacterium]
MAALLVGSYKWFRSEVTARGAGTRWYSKERLYVRVGMPPRDRHRPDRRDHPGLRGQGAWPRIYAKEMQVTHRPRERPSALIEFPPDDRGSSCRPYALKEELIQLATQFAGIDVSVSGFDPPVLRLEHGRGRLLQLPHQVLRATTCSKLKEITGDLEKTLRRNPRIKEVRTVSSRFGWWRGDTVEDILKIDKAALKRYDVDPGLPPTSPCRP